MRPAIALWGRPTQSPCNLREIAAEFGWEYVPVHNVEEIAAIAAASYLVAVVAIPSALGTTWKDALAAVQGSSPGTLIVMANTFSEDADWTEMADAGVFHSFAVPMNRDEVHQSFGFVASAVEQRQRARAAKVTTMRAVA